MKKLILLVTITFISISLLKSQEIRVKSINVEEPEFVGKFIFVRDSITGEDLEKQEAAMKVSGYLQYKGKYVVEGSTSDVIIEAKPKLYFIVRAADNMYDPEQFYCFYKLKQERSKRFLVVNSMGIAGNKTLTENTVPFFGRKYGESSYLLEISNVEPGEYAVAIKGLPTLFLFSIK